MILRHRSKNKYYRGQGPSFTPIKLSVLVGEPSDPPQKCISGKSKRRIKGYYCDDDIILGDRESIVFLVYKLEN